MPLHLTRFYFCILTLLASSLSAAPISEIVKQPDAVLLKSADGVLRLQVWSDRVVRVTYAPGATLPEIQSLGVIATPAQIEWTTSETPQAIELFTRTLRVAVDRTNGSIRFSDLTGKPILNEAEAGRKFAPSAAKQVNVTSVGQSFALDPDESIFGLGQHPQGVWNYRGTSVHLQQKNADIGVPVLVSSRGYGVLWDNPAVTDIKVGIKGRDGFVDWLSEAGDAIDYYFIYGPSIDQIIQSYRALTGPAPMFGKWAFGYWQSRERYVTQDEILGVAREYRKRGIPIDGMVQDWQYWFPQPWGSHAFGTNFPDPKGMMKELHTANFHAIISVWAKFDQGTKNYDELDKAGLLYPPIYPNVFPKGNAKWYDAFNADGRKMYWRQMSEQIFSTGFDGWWLDATEPELGGKWGELRDLQTAAGPGYRVFNAYPLMTTSAVYEGQRNETSQQRAFILTRSAYTGQQRNAAVAWSGDIGSDWATFKRQIPGGLNFVLTGIPYWNTDIGGFFSRATNDPDYRECFTRWFQFGAFTGMFRVHGTNAKKEMWEWGAETEKTLRTYNDLRYRLLPYIYSTAWRVTNEGYSLMRPLVMDFPNDQQAIAIPDQFLFGPAIMVCPVTEPIAGSGTVIPGTSLIDAAGKPGGISATYFQGNEFAEKKLERVDESISFAWDKAKREGVGENVHHDPIPGLNMDHFSVRWEGSVLTQQAGEYEFTLTADDGMRLWIDGKLLIEDWASRAVVTRSAKVQLPANATVPIKVEYYQNVADAVVELRWQIPSSDKKLPTRKTYIPHGAWHDFWTGKPVAGGQSIDAPAPIETMPIYVRAGSIIPMGPKVQYAMEKNDPVELRIYRGADGQFTLYDDEGDNYNYEKGMHSTIPLKWNEAAQTLSIGARIGTYPGMARQRNFHLVLVSPEHGIGVDETSRPDREIDYVGEPVQVKFEP